VKGSQQPENKDDCEVGRPTVSPPCILVTSTIFFKKFTAGYTGVCLSVGFSLSVCRSVSRSCGVNYFHNILMVFMKLYIVL